MLVSDGVTVGEFEGEVEMVLVAELDGVGLGEGVGVDAADRLTDLDEE